MLDVTPPLDETETGSLARLMGDAYHRVLEFYRDRFQLAPSEADAQARDLAADLRVGVAATPFDQLTWFRLATLFEHDPEAGRAIWARVRAEAVDELLSGHRIAATLDHDSSPLSRARFLAIRDAFRHDWQPQGGAETALVDSAAQCFSMYLFWLERLSLHAVTDAELDGIHLKKHGTWQPPRVASEAALDQEAAMVDRFHRLFLRSLRALRDLRRHAPQLVVENAGQVNLGGLNLSQAAVGGRPTTVDPE